MDLIRGLSETQKQTLRRSSFFPNLMLYIDWPGTPLRMNLSRTNMIYRGETFYGFGGAAGLTLPSEASGIAAASASLAIAGVEHDLGTKVTSPARGRSVSVFLALMSEPGGGSGIGDPVPLFRGTIGSLRMRTSSRSVDERLSTLEVDLSTGPSARAKSSIYHTNEDQQLRYPTDTAGRLVILAYAKAQKLRWPE